MNTISVMKSEDESVEQADGQTSTPYTEAVSVHRDTYGRPGFRGLFSNYYVVLCAAFSTLGGFIFGQYLI